MEKKLRKKCEKLHKQNKFGEIITLFEGQPHDDYDAASQLARAYNNKGRFQEAVSLLEAVSSQGADDPLWHFRLGYAYDHLGQYEQALASFEKVLELAPRDWEARLYIRQCRKKIKKSSAQADKPAETNADDDE